MISKVCIFVLVSVMLFGSCKGSGSSNTVKSASQNEVASKDETPFLVAYSLTDSTQKNSLLGTIVLGRAKKGELLQGGFTLNNNSSKGIVIFEITASCGCTNVSYSKSPIGRGDFKNFRFAYDSKDKQGQQFSQITVLTSSGNYIVELELFIE